MIWGLPCLRDNDIVERGVAFAKASEADFKYHHLTYWSLVKTGIRCV